jgi:hypothetical protein
MSTDGLCQYPSCWRFPYLNFHFCIKHKCQNHQCNGYKITNHEYCSFHKCSYEIKCPNQREFLHYQSKHVPVYSKFCPVHNYQYPSPSDDDISSDSSLIKEKIEQNKLIDEEFYNIPLVEMLYAELEAEANATATATAEANATATATATANANESTTADDTISNKSP